MIFQAWQCPFKWGKSKGNDTWFEYKREVREIGGSIVDVLRSLIGPKLSIFFQYFQIGHKLVDHAIEYKAGHLWPKPNYLYCALKTLDFPMTCITARWVCCICMKGLFCFLPLLSGIRPLAYGYLVTSHVVRQTPSQASKFTVWVKLKSDNVSNSGNLLTSGLKKPEHRTNFSWVIFSCATFIFFLTDICCGRD